MNGTNVTVLGYRVAVDGPSPRLLVGLKPSEVEEIMSAATPRVFSEGGVVLHQEDPAERLFLLTKGQGRQFILTDSGQKVIMFWLTKGHLFGGASILWAPRRLFVSTELDPGSCALMWERQTMRSFIGRFPRLLDNALSIAATEHIAWSIAARVSLSSNNAAGRLAHLLVSLACGIGKDGPCGGIEIEAANEDLAAGSNVTPFTVSRVLSDWQRKGILTKRRGKILLLRPEQLISR
jgi:CRP-like cAMP-binding protein